MYRFIVLFFLSALLYPDISAQKPAIAPAPSWIVNIQPDFAKKPIEKDISDGYYLDLSDLQIHVPAQTEYHHIIRHIINESGVQAASEVSVNYSPEFQHLVFHYINLVRNGKIVSRISPAAIKVIQEESESDNYQYNNEKRAFVVLEDTRKDDQVDFAYSIVGFNPVFKNKFQRSQYMSMGTPVTNFFIAILSQPENKLNLHYFNNASKPQISTYQSLTLYQWKQPELKSWESQTSVPSWFDNYPYFTITAYNSWAEVADWAVRVFKSYDYPLSAAVKKKIAEMQSIAKGDQDFFAELAIRYVQDKVRYLGIEVGAYSHKPHDPNQVFRQGYGDCKDKSLLLVRILQEAKIPAYVAMLNTTLKDKVDLEAPSPSVFNHAIVAIERSSGYIFIDPTYNNQRGSLVNNYIPAYGKALLIKAGNTKFDTIAPGEINSSRVEEILTVKFPGEGDSKLQVKSVYAGGAADNIRDFFSSNSSSDIKKSYEEYYTSVYDSILLDGEVQFRDDSMANEVTVIENYSISKIWIYADEEKEEVPVFAKAIYEKLTSPKNHYAGAPLSLTYPANLNYSLKIIMPEDWVFPLKPLSISNASYTFTYNPSFHRNEIQLQYTYRTLKDHIPENELNEFKTDYTKMEKSLGYSLYKASDSIKPSYSSGSGSRVYWPAVQLALVVASGLILLMRNINKKDSATSNWEYSPDGINGWTGLLGLTLGISFAYSLYKIFSEGYFNADTIDKIKDLNNKAILYSSLIELAVLVAQISFVGGLLYWFLKKRDIFPTYFTAYAVSLFGANLLLLGTYAVVGLDNYVPGAVSTMVKVVFQSCIYGMVWISYIRRSENVQRYFTVPYMTEGGDS